MQKLQVTGMVQLAAMAAFAALSVSTQSFAQEAAASQMSGYSDVVPWTGGTQDDALTQSASGTTIPLSRYAVDFNKNANIYTGVLVGANPFGASPHSVTIDAILIPLIVEIITPQGKLVTFDPTKPNSCDGGFSAEHRFRHSPLVVDSSLTFNGVNVGNVQYINGFMRAEFWNQIHATSFSDPISWSFAAAQTLIPLNAAVGIVNGTGCEELAIISKDFLDFNIRSIIIPNLQAQGVISPTKFAAFLMKNVVMSSATPPTATACCIYGYHGATGTPVQTYSPFDYDTTGRIPPDTSIAAHEIGEWMNDPLGNNATPPWGHIGQVSKCQGNFEVGDPLTGTNMPVISLSGFDYHVQELAFFSWYFNGRLVPSLGAGGKFSGNGTFKGPSKDCPPGGTF